MVMVLPAVRFVRVIAGRLRWMGMLLCRVCALLGSRVFGLRRRGILRRWRRSRRVMMTVPGMIRVGGFLSRRWVKRDDRKENRGPGNRACRRAAPMERCSLTHVNCPLQADLSTVTLACERHRQPPPRRGEATPEVRRATWVFQ